jgi:hypothetical protein
MNQAKPLEKNPILIEFSYEELKLLLGVCFAGITSNSGENFSIKEFTQVSKIAHRIQSELDVRENLDKKEKEKKKEEEEEDWNLEPNAGS